jgi:hypothetical protein
MIDFLLANIESVGTALVAVILLAYAIITRQWGLLRSAALSLMLSAERLLATEQGQLKMEWVFREVQQNIPIWLRPYLTEDKLREILQELYDNAKHMIH